MELQNDDAARLTQRRDNASCARSDKKVRAIGYLTEISKRSHFCVLVVQFVVP